MGTDHDVTLFDGPADGLSIQPDGYMGQFAVEVERAAVGPWPVAYAQPGASSERYAIYCRLPSSPSIATWTGEIVSWA